MNIASIILSSGFSKRMNFHKAFLRWNGKISFAEKIICEYNNIKCKKIITVLNQDVYDYYNKNKYSFLNNTKIIVNKFPQKGRFYSIKLAAQEINNIDYCFIQNIDNPFVDNDMLNVLLNNKNNNGYSSLLFNNKGGHPILISKEIIDKINKTVEYNLNFRYFLNQFERIKINYNNKNILININSIDEYKKYFGRPT